MGCRLTLVAFGAALVFFFLTRQQSQRATRTPAARAFAARGTVEKINRDENIIVISHEAIGSYMGAMTMPFKLKRAEELDGVKVGDQISFQLSVTDTQSWVEHIGKLAAARAAHLTPATTQANSSQQADSRHPLLDYAFTNELGQPVTLHSFKGQALAISFFFTRCPIPDFCPRLSKNFAEASRKLNGVSGSPTNWHFLSVSFDPEFDSPEVLKAYGERYQYDPAHWSFITGPKDKIAELARLSNVQIEPDSGLFNHNFRTMIIDAAGHLQMIFPIGGDLSDAIATEIIKAANVTTNKPS